MTTQHTVVGAIILLLNCCTQTLYARVIDYTPQNGPISGGTLIHIQGDDFVTTGRNRSKCSFQQPGRASTLSSHNEIVNSSYLICEMPSITFVLESELQNGHVLDLVVITGTQSSNSVPFLVYDLMPIFISQITPDEGITNRSDVMVSIATSGVLNTSELTCSLAGSRSETIVPAIFINSTFLQCQLLPYPQTSVVQVEVSLNGQPAANINPSLADATQFTFYSPPPEILSCQFTPSYAMLLLSFDREVELGGENRSTGVLSSNELSCELLFIDDTLETIGTDSQCNWYNTQQRQVIIQLTSSTQVRLNSVLTLRNDTIRTRYLQYSRLVSGSVSVSSITDPQLFKPLAIIEAPRVIPTCGNFTISGGRSQYGGVSALEYEWIIGTEVNSSNGRILPEPSLAGYIPEGFTRQSLLEIPAEAFNDDIMSGSGSGITPVILTRNYTIQLSVRNFLGVVSTTHIDGISQAERLLPNLIIVGGTLKHLRSSLENTLQGIVTIKQCSQDTSLVFQYIWSVTDDETNEFVSGISTDSSVLVLPPGLLKPDSIYTAILSVRYGGENDVISDSVTIVTDIEIQAMIRGGDRRALSVNDVIILDGSTSKGVTLLPSNTTLMVSWQCRESTSNDSCIGQNGQPLSLSNTELVQTIEADQLSSDAEYEFSLILTLTRDRGNETILESTAHQILHVFPNSIPIVEVYPSPGINLNTVLVQRELTLLASIHSSNPGYVSWSVEYVEGYGQLELSEDIVKTPLNVTIISMTDIESQRFTYRENQPVLFTSNSPAAANKGFTNQLSLVLKKNTLITQNSYRLKLTAVDTVLGRTGFAEVDIRTASEPTSGRLKISPSTGRPLSTVFTLSALGWTDNIGDTPLLYRFGLRYQYFNIDTTACYGGTIVNDNCVYEYWLSGITEMNQLSSILPASVTTEDDNISVVTRESVVLQVYDNKGAVMEVSQNLQQLINENSNEDVSSNTQLLMPVSEESMAVVNITVLLDDIEQTFRDTGDWIQTLSQLTAVLATLEIEQTHNVFNIQTSQQLNITGESIEQLQSRALQLILDVYDSYIPSSKSHLNIIVSLLHKTIKPLRVDAPVRMLSQQSTITRVIHLLENVIAEYNAFEKGAAFSYAGFNKKESFLILDVLQYLIQARSDTDTPHSTILRIREDDITRSLLRVVPTLGYGLCLQQALNEEAVFVHSSESFVTLKTSWINLPNDYKAGSSSVLEVGENIVINFARPIFRRYLQWQCTNDDNDVTNTTIRDQYCSGVCITSAQHAHNIVWQGSVYSSQIKMSLLQLLLINPTSGVNLLPLQTTSKRQTDNQLDRPIEMVFPITAPFSNLSNLVCVQRQDRQWNENNCVTHVSSTTAGSSVVCQCSIEQLSSSPITVLERCPDGYYGELCENVCPQDLWGFECQRSCECNNRGLCSPVDGSCDCVPGWMGEQCEQMCSTGTWGDGCGEVCLCDNGASCDPVNGACTCTTGWIGTHCNISCPDGFYGDNCASSCECREVAECTDKINGRCTCQTGYTGNTCEQTCPTGFYGLGCTSECECSTEGTRVCDHINGLCDCLGGWRGFYCEIEVTTPPPTTPVPVSSFEIWWIIVGVVIVILIAAVIIVVIIVVVCVRKKKHSKVLPISVAETGDSDRQSWKKEVATSPGSSDSSEIELTRTHSLEVLVPPGKTLKDMFSPAKSDRITEEEFKEPNKINDKLRWQVVRLKANAREVSYKSTSERKSPTTKNGVMETSVDEDHVTEVIYKRGIYLTSDSTLKHLRNKFIDSGQLDSNNRHFRFLRSDVPGDYIEIDTEDETLLIQIETSLIQHRTLYIESIDSGCVEAERCLCVCGKYADMECPICQKRGYCSSKCQQGDWFKHQPYCRNKDSVTGSRRERKSSKKHGKKKRHGDHKSSQNSSSHDEPTSVSMSQDTCICGKEAEFECSICGKQGYCSEKCQLEDWSHHEYYCKQPVSDTAAASGAPERTVITPTKQPLSSVLNSDKTLLTVPEESDEEVSQ